MTLLFLGPPRTATNSLFDLLRKHPHISESKLKEPFNDSPFKYIFPYRYFSEFKTINQNTRILLDGTPCPYSFWTNKVIEIPSRKKIIYPVRNPFDRVYSTIKQTIITKNKNKKNLDYPPYIKDNYKIDNKKLIEYIPHMMDDRHIKGAFNVTDDVFIFRFDEINMKDIFNFLEIEPIDDELKKLNKMKIWYTNEYKEIKIIIDKIWKNNRKEITKIILEDLNKIKQYVNVEDWIEEANNILFDV